MLKVTFMKGSGKNRWQTVMDSIHRKMEQNMRAFGKMISNTGKEKKHGLMELPMKEISFMV
jgi:hypothetical protein